MNVRPPRILARRPPDNPLSALEHEVQQEKVATLSRLGRRLEQALAALADCEAAGRETQDGPDGDRESLLAEAGEALWHFVVQREAMGLRNTEQALKAYGVPQAVRLRMGAAPRRRR
ncbi:MAG TPA: DUF6665 family protein [Afifellaceae bacterium]|nr:DUF6665 family protein [Afifellaceae bacterium]